MQRGQGSLSDFQVANVRNEELQVGKVPAYRLLVLAVDGDGKSMPDVTYVVSEQFVVRTTRVAGQGALGHL